jgi:protein TonB
MFALIESARVQPAQGAWSGRVLSLAIHAGLITAALLATRQVAVPVPPPILALPMPSWPSPRQPAPAPCHPCQLPGRPFPTTIPVSLPDPRIVVPPAISVEAPGAGTDSGTASPGIPVPGGGFAPGEAPLAALAVDEPPVMLSHPELHYPEILRQAGIAGRAVIEAVLDTTGRAEAASLRVVSTSHPLFAAEAEQVILGSRYRPGRMAGRAVRVRVLVPVSFDIRR